MKALMDISCIPAGMELFPAADEGQFEFIKRVIDGCDYYLLIIGGRYGSVSPDGISYTEKEYEYAVEKGLKIIALLHKNPDDIPAGKSEMNPDLRHRLQSFRDKVATNRLVKFWSKAEDLPHLVSVSVSIAIINYPASGWVRSNNILNLIEYPGKRDFSRIRDIANQALNEVGDEILHIYMTNFDLKKQGSLRDDWNKFFIKKGNRVFQHLFFCIRSAEDCDFILKQVDIIKEFKAKEHKDINYELRVIFDHDQTDLSPWSILVLGEQKAFLSHDTKNDKKLSLQCFQKEDVKIIKRLWESFLGKDNMLLYSKELGPREESIKYLKEKKTFYSKKACLKEEDAYKFSILIRDCDLFFSEPIGCYLIGSLAQNETTQANDIDLVFLFNEKPRHPEEMVKMSKLSLLFDTLNTNLNLNGIPQIESQTGFPTVDILCDWTEYIHKHDAVSIIDIAHGNYRTLWGKEDAYFNLRNNELTKKLISERITTSYNYVKRNCTSNDSSLIKIAGKQFLQSFSMADSSCFDPGTYLKSINDNAQILYYRPVLAYYSPESFLQTNIINEILSCYDLLKHHLEKQNVT